MMKAKCHCGKEHERTQPENFYCECGRPMFVDMFKNTDDVRNEQVYHFIGYYKYQFRLRLEDGTDIINEGDSDEIYRLEINQTGIAKPYENEAWLVDGVVFRP